MKKQLFSMQKQRGFTLIEIIIGMLIICLMIGAVGFVSISSWRSQKYDFEKSANIENERQIISYLGSEIRNAITINNPAEGNSATTLSYLKINDPAARTITLGSGSDANTIIVKDPNGSITKRLGIARVQTLQFQRGSSTLAKQIKINLIMKNLPGTTTPSNNISTIIYTLN